MDARNLPGSLKIAILIQSLGTETSQIIMRNLADSEKQAVLAQMEQLGNVSPELVEKIAEEFVEQLQRRNHPANDQIQGKASNGDSDAKAVAASGGANLEAIVKLEPDRLFKLVENEHPQTIAIILVHAKTEAASEVMSRLSDEVKTDVALRIARLDKVSSGMVEEINHVIEAILSNKETSQTHETCGVDRLAEILNLADEMSSELIMGEIEEQNPELAAQIKQKMFVFEDIILVDDKGFQKLLRKVETAETGRGPEGGFGRCQREGFPQHVGPRRRYAARRNCRHGTGPHERCLSRPAKNHRLDSGYGIQGRIDHQRTTGRSARCVKSSKAQTRNRSIPSGSTISPVFRHHLLAMTVLP